ARAITPTFAGESTCFPPVISAGDSVTNQYTFTLPAEWDENNMYIIGMLVAPNGRIDNAAKTTIPVAVANGLIEACNLSTGTILPQLDDLFKVYPNPANEYATVEINVKAESDVQLRLLDLSGKVIAASDYGTIATSSVVNLNTADLNTGVYLVELTVNGERMTKRLVVE
ncbi:MAG: T9SS type A sorting domain-containing protein, partial [Crocinitomicaceae bacterium]